MNYVKPSEPGYYWYNPGLERGDNWYVVKVEEYEAPEPGLYFQNYSPRKSTRVSESQGVWGEKIAEIGGYDWIEEDREEKAEDH